MGLFDSLIDVNNKEPKPNMEYVYLHDMVWNAETGRQQKIERRTIMIDVVKNENRSFSFTCKETGEKFTTNYGWTLAENTPENIEKIDILDKELESYVEHGKKVKELRDNIVKLV